jgi:putative endonuclease
MTATITHSPPPKKKQAYEYGKSSEAQAQNFLEERGYQTLERNFRCSVGEIDLIVAKDDQLIFVEVRSRKQASFLHPLESLSQRKLQRLRRTAEYYLKSHRAHQQKRLRFDVISIVDQSIDHLPHAF